MKRTLAAFAATVVLGTAATAAAQFRVLPYQMMPSTDGMRLIWMTDADVPGTLEISGGDLAQPLTFTSTPEYQEILQYLQPELDQAAAQGYPVLSNDNWKHVVDVRVLTPGTTYDYTVTQGSETFTGTLRTAPSPDAWTSIRFMAMSDSETEPRGVTNRRDWSVGTFVDGSVDRPDDWPVNAAGRDLYPLTEFEGYRQNLRILKERDPHFVVMPGDLVQGGGYQLGWDEFFRHGAGEYDTIWTDRPLLPALGNWENFAAVNGGYGPEAVERSRTKYKAYFDAPSNGTPEHQDQYYRIDYGPVTVLTLDSSNGLPDETRDDPTPGTEIGTDTQENVAVDTYPGDDLADFNPGSAQYEWVIAQLEDARADGRIVFVQFHHPPFSSGVHGFPMSHPDSSGQGGTPMRIYHPLFEQYGVAAVFCGHSEMFERSFVDEDGDGAGVHYFDVGVSGDGMRGGVVDSVTGVYGGQNPFSQWTADQDSPELWVVDGDGVTRLLDGGKHYGHLEVNVASTGGAGFGTVSLTPVYSFPNLDASYQLVGDTERRIYGDQVVVALGADGAPIAFDDACLADADGSGTVDFGDVLSVLSGGADLNGDGTSDVSDVLIVLGSFGGSCTP